MNAEKFVKNEAKASLKGNWIKALAALFTSVIVIIAVLLVVGVAFAIMGDYDDLGQAAAQNPLMLIFFVMFHLIAVAGLILLSPVFAGCTRVIGSLANDKKADISDMFIYFSGVDIYKDCVKFMTRVIVGFVLVLILCEMPCLAGFILFQDMDYADIIVIILGVLGFIGAYLFSLRNVFSVMLYTGGCSAKESFDKGSAAAKGNVGKLVKLTFSFIGWILSFVFVVPALYAVPYIGCSYFVSAKYLIEQYDKSKIELPINGMASSDDISDERSGYPVTFNNPNYTSAQNAEPLTFDDGVTENANAPSETQRNSVGGEF